MQKHISRFFMFYSWCKGWTQCWLLLFLLFLIDQFPSLSLSLSLTHTLAHAHACMWAHTTCISMCIHTSSCTHICMHSCMHTHTHTHTILWVSMTIRNISKTTFRLSAWHTEKLSLQNMSQEQKFWCDPWKKEEKKQVLQSRHVNLTRGFNITDLVSYA